MKIAIAHNLYGAYAKGGAEKVVKEMIENFQGNGDEVFLITTEPKKEWILDKEIGAQIENKVENENGFKIEIKDQVDLRPEIEKENPNLKIYRVPSSYYNLGEKNKFYRPFWHLNNFCNPKKAKLYQEILEKEKPDLIITHNLIGLGFFLVRISNSLKINHEHFLHDIQLLHPSGLMIKGEEKKVNSLFAKLYQAIVKAYFLKTKKVISPSAWLLEEHKKRGFFKNIETEIRPFRKIRADIQQDHDKVKSGNENQTQNQNQAQSKNLDFQRKKEFLFLGQVETHKGILFLIETFKKIKDKNTFLKIIGDGRDFEKAKSLAKNDTRIIFLGRMGAENVKEEMRKIAILKNSALIVPSLCYENSPTVIYEANEIPLKVIASNLGGIPEIIKKDDILFNAGDEKDLLEKLRGL